MALSRPTVNAWLCILGLLSAVGCGFAPRATSTSTSTALAASAKAKPGFVVSSPADGSTVAPGMIQISGQASAGWVNVAAYDLNNGMKKVASDVQPQSGSFVLSVDSSLLSTNPARIAIIAFSVSKGKLRGSRTEVDLTLTIAQPGSVAANAFQVTSPQSGAQVSGMFQIAGVAGSEWMNVAAYAPDQQWKKIAVDVTPQGNAFALSVNSSSLPNGSNRIAVIAFSVAAGQAGGTYQEVDLNLNVQNGVAPTPTPMATPVPTPVATPNPTPQPTPMPTPAPTPMPTPVATPMPTPVPTPVPTASGVPKSLPVMILHTAYYSSNGLNLAGGQSLSLPNGTQLAFSTAGDLAVKSPAGAVVWHSGTSGSCASGCNAVFQGDGNFVISIAGQAVWSSNTFNNGAGHLVFSDNQPYLMVTDGNSMKLWDSGGSSPVLAVSANDFLNSTGVNTHIDQGYDPNSYIQPLQYLGVRNIRDGTGNLSSLIRVHQNTGVRVAVGSYYDLQTLLSAAKTLAQADALLAVEGPNEPNNFVGTYNGQKAGGNNWLPVAQYQRDLYNSVKADPTLSSYPVFSPSETGAETQNVGLQFLTIPSGAGTLMPDGTKFADFVNPHNYVSSNSNQYVNNQAWFGADPLMSGPWDGIYGNNLVTWGQHFQGPSLQDGATLPRVTTETGWDSVNNVGGEAVQGVVLVNTYLAQFKRGYRYTFIYELRDEEGSTGYQGLFRPDSSAKPAATYIHNLTSILADSSVLSNPGSLAYSIPNQPATVHDLLIQKSNGTFELVVWGENASGSDTVTVNFGSAHAGAKIYDVTVGTSPVQTLGQLSSVTLTLKDHPVIIELQ